MTQEFKLKGDEFPSHLFINAIMLTSKEDYTKLVHREKKEFDIEFKVNGIELNFEKTVVNLYERMKEDIKEQAFNLVKEKIELADILKTIETFNNKIAEFEDDLDTKLRDIFKIKGD